MVASPTNLHSVLFKYKQMQKEKNPTKNTKAILYFALYMHYLSNCILTKADFFSAKINKLV